MRLSASGHVDAPPHDLWALLAEPRHLSDWWPGYVAVNPDRRKASQGARWAIVRSGAPGLLRRPGGDGLVVITLVEPGRALAWRDLQQDFVAHVGIEAAEDGSVVSITLAAAWWRIPLEGLRGLPRQALGRLRALCQTSATIAAEVREGRTP